jgi:DNA polymerase/3'-5' exonuclease PolX
MRHVASGIPVDLFATTEACWHNYLVCRTGPAESNIRIAAAAKARGWKWNPYGEGFSRGGPLAGPEEARALRSEREVFEFVGLPYTEPEERR